MTDNSGFDSMLNDDARELLDSYLDLQRIQLVEKALHAARERSIGEQISSRDIARAIATASTSSYETPVDSYAAESAEEEKLWIEEQYLRRRMRSDRLLLIIRVYGLFLLALGTLGALYYQFGDTLQPATAAAIAVAIAGGFLGIVVPLLLNQTQRQREAYRDFASASIRPLDTYRHRMDDVATEILPATRKDSALKYTYLERWAELERSVRRVAAEHGAVSPDRRISLRDTAISLIDYGVFTETDVEKFFQALRMRNNLAHAVYDEDLSEEDIKEMLSVIAHLQYHLDGLL